MKNKKGKVLIIIALLTWALMVGAFTFEEQTPIMEEQNSNPIVPFWVNTDDISLKTFLFWWKGKLYSECTRKARHDQNSCRFKTT